MLLARDIDAAAATTDVLWGGAVLELTHVRGPSNAHLTDERRESIYLPRAWPLPPDAEVRGEFLTLLWEWHSPCLLLDEHASLADVEAAIIGGAGVSNPFTGCVLAFVGGQLRGYEVRRRADGLLVAKGGVRVNEDAWDPLATTAIGLVFRWSGG